MVIYDHYLCVGIGNDICPDSTRRWVYDLFGFIAFVNLFWSACLCVYNKREEILTSGDTERR